MFVWGGGLGWAWRDDSVAEILAEEGLGLSLDTPTVPVTLYRGGRQEGPRALLPASLAERQAQ